MAAKKDNKITSVKVSKNFGSEGPKRSVASKPKSKLAPKSTDSVMVAKLIKQATDILTKIPGIQDKDSQSNKNLRLSSGRNLQKAKAQAGAAAAGNTARSQMAVTRARSSAGSVAGSKGVPKKPTTKKK